MKNKLILLLVLLIPSLCFGSNVYKLIITHYKEDFVERVYIVKYNIPNASKDSGLFDFKLKEEKSNANESEMRRLMLYLRKENLLSHFSEKRQESKFSKYDFYTDELIINQFLFSNYKVTAMHTEKTNNEGNRNKTERTYFFSK
tara:strand:+ start:2049 stop:2480 length:432 start_codon:yes stop_codon:yes gene_type:complete